MKQVVQNYRSGELAVLDVPVPACKPGGVLVRTQYSLISAGTELMKVSEANKSLLGKARARPDQVRKVVDAVTQQGPLTTYHKVVSRLDSYTPLGYSLCGEVIEVGRGAEAFKVGQTVACGGNQYAHHAEVNWVPTNLCVGVPDAVDPRLASFATVGAIALHAVRRAEAQLGETACVIGLGLVGQLVTRLLIAAGVQVIGLDPLVDRRELARSAGAISTASPSREGAEAALDLIGELTGGLGADHVFVTSGGSTAEPVRLAAAVARDRARVVDVGKCRLDLPWDEFYDKELELRLSRSYGPGRYDDRYELEGIDYPPGYVRWTERRNLECFLGLMARKDITVEPLVSDVFPVEEATGVYERLSSGGLAGVGFLFEYPGDKSRFESRPTGTRRDPTALPSSPREAVRVGFLGAGNYASSVLLPHLAERDDVELARVVTTTSLSALNAQRRFGFEEASTDISDVLDDEEVDVVFIVTRHHSHADLVCAALERQKTVFVEKPLALTDEELDRVVEAVRTSANDRLMVGFNRRFAPMFRQLRSIFGPATGPAVVRYLVNAGPLEPGSWYLNEAIGGTRFEGEGGHFIDTVSWWLDARPVEVHALPSVNSGGLVVNLSFDDGSAASLAYVTNGNSRYPKEAFDAFSGGRVAVLENFRRGGVWVGRRRRRLRPALSADKGQRNQLCAFLDAVRSGRPMPIPMDSLIATTRATLAVRLSCATGRPHAV